MHVVLGPKWPFDCDALLKMLRREFSVLVTTKREERVMLKIAHSLKKEEVGIDVFERGQLLK